MRHSGRASAWVEPLFLSFPSPCCPLCTTVALPYRGLAPRQVSWPAGFGGLSECRSGAVFMVSGLRQMVYFSFSCVFEEV